MLETANLRQSASPLLLKAAWTENPKLAVQIAVRSQSSSLLQELRWHLLHEPEGCLDDPDALHVLFEGGLGSDISSQLRVFTAYIFAVESTNLSVPTLLGSRKPNYGSNILPPSIPKRSFHHTICDASLGKPFG